jgi:hypothetical protein
LCGEIERRRLLGKLNGRIISKFILKNWVGGNGLGSFG